MAIEKGFIEKARWDKLERQWNSLSGPSFSTSIASMISGKEQRIGLWSEPRGLWEVGDRGVLHSDYNQLLSFFHIVKGQLYGFRIRDWTDYKDDGAGILGTTGKGDGTTKTFQMYKKRTYDFIDEVYLQKIKKPIGPTFATNPVGNTISIFINGNEVFQGSGANTCTVDDTTGLVTFNFDDAPSSTDVLTWTGCYDKPARFNTDSFQATAKIFIENGTDKPDVGVQLPSIQIIELK